MTNKGTMTKIRTLLDRFSDWVKQDLHEADQHLNPERAAYCDGGAARLQNVIDVIQREFENPENPEKATEAPQIEIRGIRYNPRKGRTYAKVYVDGELNCGATLEFCLNRVQELLGEEDF